MKFYMGVNPAEKREKILNSEPAKMFVDEVIAKADAAIAEPDRAFKMSEYMLFFKTGNRKVFERGYFDRRNKCVNILIAYWLTRDEKYFEPLIDYISYICDEFTWCVPAHTGRELHRDTEFLVKHVDLFQAETARLFAEAVMLVGDELPDYVLDRMEYEVRRRIFASFSDPDVIYFWESCKMNWATVCGAGCMMAALYFGTEEEKKYFAERFRGCLDTYLDGIEDDGCCQEGMAYWTYGFAHFVILAEALKVYTNGEIDYFNIPKVKEIALFPQRVRMSGSKVASISDGGENFTFKIGMLSFLKEKYEEVLLPELDKGTLAGNVNSVTELLWFDENYRADKMTCETNYLSGSQWYTSRREKYSFVSKGGHNNEPHNHNDIGSFMITAGEETFISDLGAGEYVRETFMPETRYTFLQNSSRGHSVPIINGQYQKEGSEYCAEKVKVDENSFELNMEKAYADGVVKEFKRRFELEADKVKLTDVFDFGGVQTTVTERFVSKIKPELCDGYVDFGFAKIVYDSSRYIPDISTDEYSIHSALGKQVVYLVDFVSVSKDENVFEFEFAV